MLQPWLYRHALERGYFDALLTDWVIEPFYRTFRGLDQIESRFEDWAGGESEAPDPISRLDLLEQR